MAGLTCDTIADRDLVVRYVTDRLERDTLVPFEAHLLTCDRCQDEVRLALALREELSAGIGDAAVSSETALPGRRFTIAAMWTGLAAAAALLLVVVLPRSLNPPDAPPEHRAVPGVGMQGELAPVPLAPVGNVERVSNLVWSRSDGANRYRITLLAESGSIVWESETPDTTIAVPSELSLTGGITYFWKVDARFGFDRWLGSDVAEFRLLPTPAGAQSPGDSPDARPDAARPPASRPPNSPPD